MDYTWRQKVPLGTRMHKSGDGVVHCRARQASLLVEKKLLSQLFMKLGVCSVAMSRTCKSFHVKSIKSQISGNQIGKWKLSALPSGDKLLSHWETKCVFQMLSQGLTELKITYTGSCLLWQDSQGMQGPIQVNFPNRRFCFERQELFRSFNHVYRNNSNICQQ